MKDTSAQSQTREADIQCASESTAMYLFAGAARRCAGDASSLCGRRCVTPVQCISIKLGWQV